MKTASGWLQGFNAQAAVNANQVVLACAVTQDRNDVAQLVPMTEAVAANAAAAGIDSELGTVLADAGYWSEANATAPGPDRLIATSKDWKQRRAARAMGTTTGAAPEGASTLEAMEHRLRTADGAAAYGQRSCTVEPVFGQAKENRGVRRFMRRGLAAAESEWALVCATANILKLFSHAQGRSWAGASRPRSRPRGSPGLTVKGRPPPLLLGGRPPTALTPRSPDRPNGAVTTTDLDHRDARISVVLEDALRLSANLGASLHIG